MLIFLSVNASDLYCWRATLIQSRNAIINYLYFLWFPEETTCFQYAFNSLRPSHNFLQEGIYKPFIQFILAQVKLASVAIWVHTFTPQRLMKCEQKISIEFCVSGRKHYVNNDAYKIIYNSWKNRCMFWLLCQSERDKF